MPDPAAVERRLHRLGVLLVGDHVRAARVVDAVLTARGAKEDRLDRLAVLRSREVARSKPRSVSALDGLPISVARAFDAFDFQAREAWILADVLGRDARAVAQAMDCSRSAAARHLDRARSVLGPDVEQARRAVRTAITRVTVPPQQGRRRLVRRRVRRLARLGLVLLAIALATTAAWWAGRALFDWVPKPGS